MEVSPQFCVVQQEPEESIFAQEKPELPSMLHRLEGLKVRKESGTPDRSLEVSWLPPNSTATWTIVWYPWKPAAARPCKHTGFHA